MAKSVKLADIAAKFQVSTVTVSKALSGQKGVSEELRAQIRETANQMGYISPSSRKKKLGTKSGYNIGVIIAERYLEKYNSFYVQLHQLIAAEAVSHESFAMLEIVSLDMEEQGVLPRLIRDRKTDGILIVGRMSDSYLELLRKEMTEPMIYVDFTDLRAEADAIISDSFYGAYTLTRYLFEMGHRRIAFVGSVLATSSITERYLGYLKAMMEHRQEVQKDWVIEDRDPVTGKLDPVNHFQLPAELPDAFVCNCDLAASLLIRKLQERGVRVPEDVSVTGYDHFLYPGLCDVALTTYEVDMREMAARAVKNLISKIREVPYRKGMIIVEGRLLIRDSVVRK